jgi:hypothetical protein
MQSNSNEQPKSVEDFFMRENMINIVVVSVNEDRANSIGKALTECPVMWKGYWIRENRSEEHRFLSYTRWPNNPKGRPTTIYADTMLVDVENQEEFKQVEDYVRSRGRIPQIIIYSTENLSSLESTFRHHNAKWVQKAQGSEVFLREMIVTHYYELKRLIQEVFDKIDTNKNGFIEKNEMKAAALELGEIATCEDFEKSFQVMDENHDGKISLKEFINWWKLGRQNSALMKRLVRLEVMTSKYLESPQLQEFKKELEDLKNQPQQSKHYVKLHSGEVENPGFEIAFNLAKNEDRDELVQGHLLSFQPHYLTQFARWIDFTFHFDDSVDKEAALQLLISTKQRLFEMAMEVFPEQVELLNRFFIFEFYKLYNQSSVLVRIRNKADTQHHLDHALYDLIELVKLINSMSFSFDFRTSGTLREILNQSTFKEAIKNYSFEIKSSLDKNLLNPFTRSLSQKDLQIFQILLAPSDINLTVNVDMNKFGLESLINENITNSLSFLEIVKMFVPEEYLTKLTGLTICANAYDVFARLKFKFPGLFA